MKQKSRLLFHQHLFLGVSISLFSLWGCDKATEDGNGNPNGNNNNNNTSEWIIPISEVFDGGPGKDGIPALSDPEFVSISDATYLNDDDLIVGFADGEMARAYPHKILDWHEIINDQVGDVNIAVTYCPLTGTGIGWGRDMDGKTTTFGVSGLLYNSNLIPYDRNTDSNWSQIRLDCVNGELVGTEIETFTLVETTWATWKEMYPVSTVVSTNTGHNRDYDRYPYGSYRTNNEYLIFPLANEDTRLPTKERVHGVVESGTSKVYPLSLFGNEVTVIQDSFKETDYVIVGNESDNFAVSFQSDPGDGTSLAFSAIQDQYPVVMTDNEGNSWDVFGNAVSGPREGTQLTHGRSFIGYWFCFAAFYPDVTIYEHQ